MKIIILDDSRTDSYFASVIAKKFFAQVSVIGTPAELHAALRHEALPDLLMMDVHIGDTHNGIGELASIKEQYTAASVIPTVIVTASNDTKVHQLALSCGADAVIVKPLTVEKLEPILRALLPQALTEHQ